MKKLIFITCVSVLVTILLAACDKIEPPYIEQTPGNDTAGCPTPTFPADTHHVKTILVEEYTGHKCPNCPAGATALHNMENTYGEKIIVIAIHAGNFAVTDNGNYSLDLRTNVGNQLNDDLQPLGYPAATFNRKTIGGQKVHYVPSAWETVFNQADTAPVLDMQMIINYNEAEGFACIHVQTEFLTDITEALKIAVYITEDSITGYQTFPAPVNEVPDYVFMHVLRGAVNGIAGTTLNTGAVNAGTKIISGFKQPVNPAWKIQHCHAIAFVYKVSNGEILQSVKGKIKP